MIDLQEYGIELDNGADRHKGSPKTFGLPCVYTRHIMDVGDYVKLIFIGRKENNKDDFEAERMWVKITEANDSEYVGTLSNDPFGNNLSPLQFGSKISFNADNIIDIG